LLTHASGVDDATMEDRRVLVEDLGVKSVIDLRTKYVFERVSFRLAPDGKAASGGDAVPSRDVAEKIESCSQD